MTRKLPTIFAIATLLAVFAAVAAGAGAGDLDLSFDHDGRKVLPGIFSEERGARAGGRKDRDRR